MASRPSLILRAIAAALTIIAILLLANVYVLIFPSFSHTAEIIILLFLAAFALFVAGRI